MIGVVRHGARWGAVLLALGLLFGPRAEVAAADGDEDNEVQAESPREVAQIKIELKLDSGRVVKMDDLFTVDWGVQNQLEIEADGSNHQLSLMVERTGDKKSKKLSITVGYDRDGEAIIAPYTFDTKLKKREVVRIEGGLAIALTVTPKVLEGEGGTITEEEELPPEEVVPPRDKIEIDDDDEDPLGGLDK